MEPVYDVMTRLLTEHFGVPKDQIRPDATLEALEFDSLARLELGMLLTDTFGVSLPEDRADITLAEAAEHLTAAVAAAGAAPLPHKAVR
ncbi:acyl carrier protein [Streptomyces sp. AN091965]|uniref:acyl carrier protein n=1 Tax=Streptomyces sp. AN091965 TaxID=2927803 RepID=UPI001F61E174|nr:phosphopantetheine-binding protein [Streptomyces sp. AN091965]MCI3927698.1 acyl carrier protein [Streptomyces sp. AN091965]MCI3927729.1 acyl carrier protein [Streptomyces sp. AN091965]